MKLKQLLEAVSPSDLKIGKTIEFVATTASSVVGSTVATITKVNPKTVSVIENNRSYSPGTRWTVNKDQVNKVRDPRPGEVHESARKFVEDLHEEFFDSQYVVKRKSTRTFEVAAFKGTKYPERASLVIQHSKKSFESPGYRKGQQNDRAIMIVKRWLEDGEPAGVVYTVDENKKIKSKKFI